MAFFDDFGKKISQVSQATVQKTKGMAELAQLNLSVNDLEGKVREKHTEIGKKYMAQLSDQSVDMFPEETQAIKELEVKIADLKEQIKTLKGVSKCPVCGAEVTNGSSFCNGCGAKIQETVVAPVVESANVTCGSCGAQVPAGKKFCTECGAQVGEV